MSEPVSTLRLKMMAKGDQDYLMRLQDMLRAQEANGDIEIVFMDDEVAEIRYRNPAWARALSDNEGDAS